MEQDNNSMGNNIKNAAKSIKAFIKIFVGALTGGMSCIFSCLFGLIIIVAIVFVLLLSILSTGVDDDDENDDESGLSSTSSSSSSESYEVVSKGDLSFYQVNGVTYYTFCLPVTGYTGTTSQFGEYGEYWKKWHTGEDFLGSKVVAVADGTVHYVSGYTGPYGYYVVLKHTFNATSNGKNESVTIYTQYCHMKAGSVTVKKGDSIKQGTVIGTVGATGNVTGAHCHFEWGYSCGTQIYTNGRASFKNSYSTSWYERNSIDPVYLYSSDGGIFKNSPTLLAEYFTNTSAGSSSSSSSSSSKITTSNKDFSSKSDSEKRQTIVAFATEFVGCKYVYGNPSRTSSTLSASVSTVKSNGLDCSGLVWYVYGHYGYNLGTTASTQAKNGKHVDASATDTSNLKMGDLLIFNDKENKNIGHIGIYIGNGKFVHADNPTKGIIVTDLSTSYYKKRFVEARRIIY